MVYYYYSPQEQNTVDKQRPNSLFQYWQQLLLQLGFCQAKIQPDQ